MVHFPWDKTEENSKQNLRRNNQNSNEEEQEIRKMQFDKASSYSSKEAKLEEKGLNFKIPVDADTRRGSNIFSVNCGNCHGLSLNSNPSIKTGPFLGNIYGRIVGGDPKYKYSKNINERTFRWNRFNLMEFIKSPKKLN